MHDVMKHLNISIALPAERLQHGVNIYILPFQGLMGQSTVNIAMCLCHISCMPYLRGVQPAISGVARGVGGRGPQSRKKSRW